MNILRIWQHPQSLSETQVVGPRYLITAFSYGNLVISCVYLATNLRLDIDIKINMMQITSTFITLIFLRMFRSHTPAAHVFLANALFNIAFLVLIFISFPFTVIMWVPVFTILAVYLVGQTGGACWTFATMSGVALAVLFGDKLNNHSLSIPPDDLPVVTVVTLYLTGVCAFVASAFFARSIKNLAQVLEKQNEKLKEQNKTIQSYAQDKAMLVSIVVHDIATPLMAILHTCEKVQSRAVDPFAYLPRIHKAAQIIKEIANSVREFQSVESGKKAVDLGVVDLRRVFERVSFVFEDLLNEKSLLLELMLPEDQPLQVVAEEKSLSNNVINNLISNAIKFSHPGQKIVVTAREEGGFVILQIRDFGVGMSENKTKTIFSKSGPSSSKGTMGEEGTGFGLPISKAYVDRFGGDIQVESIEEAKSPNDHGTTFTIKLRRPNSDENEKAAC